MRYILWDGQNELGPYDEQSVKASLDDGGIPPQTLARREAESEWMPIEALLRNGGGQVTSDTPYHHLKVRFQNEISTLNQTIHDSSEHLGDFYCPVCHSWVEYFFDYQTENGPGFLVTNGQGAGLFRQTQNTSEFVRCRNCGKRLDSNGKDLLPLLKNKLLKEEVRLEQAEMAEEIWIKLKKHSERHPILSNMARLFYDLEPFNKYDVSRVLRSPEIGNRITVSVIILLLVLYIGYRAASLYIDKSLSSIVLVALGVISCFAICLMIWEHRPKSKPTFDKNNRTEV